MLIRVKASPLCNVFTAVIPSGDSSTLMRLFGNFLDLTLTDMSCVRKGFLDAKTPDGQQGVDPDSKLLDLRWLDVIASWASLHGKRVCSWVGWGGEK